MNRSSQRRLSIPKSMPIPMLALLALLACLQSPLSADAAVRDDYAREWPLELSVADAGAYRIVLDESVYRSVEDRAMRDLQVVDADGNPVPTALQGPDAPHAGAAGHTDLAWFPLVMQEGWRNTTPGDLSVIVQRDANGRVVSIRGDAAGGPDDSGANEAPLNPAWLIDLGDNAGKVRAIELEWGAYRTPLDLAYRLEGSDDLREWSVVDPRVRLVHLQNQQYRLERNRVELTTGARYLRLLPLQSDGAPPVERVRGELAPVMSAQEWRWLEYAPAAREQHAGQVQFTYRMEGRFPIERVELALPDNAATTWALSSRDRNVDDASGEEADWSVHALTWDTWRMRDAGKVSTSPPLVLGAAVVDRDWQLVGTRKEDGPLQPRLRLGYRPGAVVFLAQGRAPYALLAGSVRSHRSEAPLDPMLATLRRTRGEAWQPAAAALQSSKALSADALQPAAPARDWKSWLLWALLIGGALLVTWFAVSLLRKPAA